MSGRKAKKGKQVKLPEGAGNLQKTKETFHDKNIDQKTVEFVESLMSLPWEPYCGRPQKEMFGIYTICRWFNQEKSWVVLYVGRGPIRANLDSHFTGHHQRTPIGSYLSSFPKESRNLIWIKWAKDPYHPYEGICIDDVISVVTEMYNDGEKPPFNITVDPREDKLPSDFSIVPNWSKTAKKKGIIDA